MTNTLLLIGCVVAIACLIELYRYNRQQPEKLPEYPLIFRSIKEGNFKAVKRINPFIELQAFKGDSYDKPEHEELVFIQVYVFITIKGKEYKQLIVSNYVHLEDLNGFINILN